MLRVLAYPPRHPYVDRLHRSAARLVHRDEPGHLPRRSDPQWCTAKASEWDVVHLHLDGAVADLPRLEEVLLAHRAAGRPIVWTVQHLRAARRPPPEYDEASWALLAELADVVVTPTLGAAVELDRCTGRRPRVIPSGAVLGPETLRRWRYRRRVRRRADPRQVLLPAGGGARPDLDLETALEAAEAVGDRIELLVAIDEGSDDDSQDDSSHPADLVGSRATILRHPPWSARRFYEVLARADAVLLPYRWCTHCAVIEMATDVGTPVLAADVGHLGDQAPVIAIPSGPAGLDLGSTIDALLRVAEHEVPAPVPLAARSVERRHFLAAHRRLYGSLVR
jgi:beta-1,4-mannosyltransferase